MKELIFSYNGIVHVIQYKSGQNAKIGKEVLLGDKKRKAKIVQTYHFSKKQIESINLKEDGANCMDCPLSHSNGGGCYTHKGLQMAGLLSMVKKLALRNIPQYDHRKFINFVEYISDKTVDLVRFGAYGEAVTLPKEIIIALQKYPYTSYTHQWRKGDHQYFMASTHSIKQTKEAAEQGYRSFMTMSKQGLERLSEEEKNWINRNLIGCPAAKESKYNKTCIECGLCNGNSRKGKGIFILTH